MGDRRPPSADGGTGSGIALAFALHVCQLLLAPAAAFLGCRIERVPDCELVAFVPVLLIGVSQWLYIVPAILIARRTGRPGLAKGFVIGASITFLLNAACWGLLSGAWRL